MIERLLDRTSYTVSNVERRAGRKPSSFIGAGLQGFNGSP